MVNSLTAIKKGTNKLKYFPFTRLILYSLILNYKFIIIIIFSKYLYRHFFIFKCDDFLVF